MRANWRILKDGSLVASTPEQRFRISDYGDGSWLLESGAVRLAPIERYVSRAHAVTVVIGKLSSLQPVQAAATSTVPEAQIGPSRTVLSGTARQTA